MCSLQLGEPTARLLQEARIIIWDEAPMSHKHLFEAADRSLRDIMKEVSPELGDLPFGGKVVVLGSDFRQVLPVVPRGTRGQIVAASLRRSRLWHDVNVFNLSIKMRELLCRQRGEAAPAAAQQGFSELLLRIGDGREPVHADLEEDMIQLPPAMCAATDEPATLLDTIFGTDEARFRDSNFMVGRGILTPKNADVDALNDRALQRFPGQVCFLWPTVIWLPVTPLLFCPTTCMHKWRTLIYYRVVQEVVLLSGDSVEEQQGGAVPVEYLNTLLLSELKPHRLTLKIGAPIMLLRNISNRTGLANGTRLIVKGILSRVIDAEIGTGNREDIGQRVFIPRWSLIPSDVRLPFDLIRRQFPIRPAFAVTINKSQGQTMDRIGLYLAEHVFSHGQLYVALSRVGSPAHITILASKGHAEAERELTRNVVYHEVFN